MVAAAEAFLDRVTGNGITCWVRGAGYDALPDRLRVGNDVRRFEDCPDVDVELVVVFGGTARSCGPPNGPCRAASRCSGSTWGTWASCRAGAEEIPSLARTIIERDYTVEERLCLEVTLRDRPGGEVLWSSFAVNEVSLEKAARWSA